MCIRDRFSDPFKDLHESNTRRDVWKTLKEILKDVLPGEKRTRRKKHERHYKDLLSQER